VFAVNQTPVIASSSSHLRHRRTAQTQPNTDLQLAARQGGFQFILGSGHDVILQLFSENHL
jgi:hypothetical protein